MDCLKNISFEYFIYLLFTSHIVCFDKALDQPSPSPARFGSLQLLAFLSVKIVIEKEEISNYEHDQD